MPHTTIARGAGRRSLVAFALAALLLPVAGFADDLDGTETRPGDFIHSNPVVLTGDTALTSTDGGRIVFADAIDGAYALRLSTSGEVSLQGAVGGTQMLADLRIDADAIGVSADVTAGRVALDARELALAASWQVMGEAKFGTLGNLVLDSPANAFGGAVDLAANAATLANGGALELGNLAVDDVLEVASHGSLALGQGSIGGALIAASNGGAVRQAGALSVGGTTTINAASGDIALVDAGNDFAGAVSLVGRSAQVRDANAINLASVAVDALSAESHGALTLGTGSVTGAMQITSNGGPIMQNGRLLVGGRATIDAGDAGSVIFDQAANAFHGPLDMRAAAAVLVSAVPLALGAIDVVTLRLDAPAGATLAGAASADHFELLGGSLKLAAGASIDGALTLAEGTELRGEGRVGALQGGGTIRPGADAGAHGQLEAASFTAASTTRLVTRIDGSSATSLAVAGTANLGGVLEVEFGPTTPDRSRHVVLTAGSIDGRFDAIVATGGQVRVTAEYRAGEVALIVRTEPDIRLTIDDGREHSAQGGLGDYLVRLENAGAPAPALSVTAQFSPAFDAARSNWRCQPGPGASCALSGNGPLDTRGIMLPAGGHVEWLVSAPLHGAGEDDMAIFEVSAMGSIVATDRNLMVLHRDGFDLPLPAPVALAPGDAHVFTPPPAGAAGIETVLVAGLQDCSWLLVDRFNTGAQPPLRLRWRSAESGEVASAWVDALVGATLVLDYTPTGDAVLTGATAPIVMPLGASACPLAEDPVRR